MAPKKGKKITLNEFLGDSALGSWADEVDALPNAPAPKLDGDIGRDDRFSRRDDSRGERPSFARDDVPLPNQPPYTAFIGNLAFDLSEVDIGNHFSDFKINLVKVIKDKDDRPKGFGYVEFESLEGLKDALNKSGTNLSGRTIRVSVAEPRQCLTHDRPAIHVSNILAKERSGFSGGLDDETKFDNPWRRDGPLPDLAKDSRRRYDAPLTERTTPGLTDGVSDWRSSGRPTRATESDPASFKRKGSTYLASDSPAEKEETWAIGSKYKPSGGEEAGSRFSSLRQRDQGPPKEAPVDESDWRGSRVLRPSRGNGGGSPTESSPSTPQMGRRKLELLPRSGNASTSQTPLSSPKMAPSQPAASKPNPFGAAKPVDVTQREKQVEKKREKERESHKDRFPISRTNSRPASERTVANKITTPPPDSKTAPVSPKSEGASAHLVATVRPTLSFASAAAAKKAALEEVGKAQETIVSKATEID